MYEVTIPGPEGRIEGRYNKGPNNNPPLVILLIIVSKTLHQ